MDRDVPDIMRIDFNNFSHIRRIPIGIFNRIPTTTRGFRISKTRPHHIRYCNSTIGKCFSGFSHIDFPFVISGAISLAVAEVNAGPLGHLGHRLNFTVAETYGEEVTSIKQTAALWAKNISAYIGPQESCVHEGRMAAAFNLPMISYVRIFLIYINPFK